jgi:hypothetical protein
MYRPGAALRRRGASPLIQEISRMTRFALAALLAVAVAGPAFATAQKPDPVLTAQTKETFDKQAAGIRAQMAPGGRYQFIKPDEKHTVEERLSTIDGILTKHVSDGKINADEKIQIVNSQEEINAILSQRDSKRLVCEHKAPTGSHRVQNVCRTYGEIEEERRNTQDFIRTNQAVKSIERGS